MAKITLDGQEIEVANGEMLIQAADRAGVYIPRFCYHEQLSVAANCRMCLVEVEKAPKPLPACATPVADGMVVKTQSELAVEAQRGTMEFLLINHPLDCPVCDQGGECPLQDQALGYGKDASRYSEKKRVVDDKDIGPLVATEMTRCIHCTRCVRFGQEIAGIMEMGALGRGENMEIATFLGESIDSEVSGNIIDLCPVGALTSKPYRFSARVWELQSHPDVSPHDCVGTNVTVQSVRGEVKRVLARDNSAINDCWISDRDRFSYEALEADHRVLKPMVRTAKGDGANDSAATWREVSWEEALNAAAKGLKAVQQQHGVNATAAIAGPTSTLEEFYLTQALVRELGGHNVDHRLRYADFSDDVVGAGQHGLGRSIASLEQLDAALLIGANIRKEQPILGLKLRKAALAGASISSVASLDYGFHFPLAARMIGAPHALPGALAAVTEAVAKECKVALPDYAQQWLDSADISNDDRSQAESIARSLCKAPPASAQTAVIVGLSAATHRNASVIRSLGQWIAEQTGASFGVMYEGNAAAAWMAGCVPHRNGANQPVGPGFNTRDMIRQGSKGWLVVNAEPELDCIDGSQAVDSLTEGFSVALTSTRGACEAWADIILPITPYTENEGSYVSCDGQLQSTRAAVKPMGDSRPAWKVLRVLGNMMNVNEFDYLTVSDVLKAATTAARTTSDVTQSPSSASYNVATPKDDAQSPGSFQCVADVPLYRTDPVVRRASALQETLDNLAPAVRMNATMAASNGFTQGQTLTMASAGVVSNFALIIDEQVPVGVVYLPGGWQETQPLLSAMYASDSSLVSLTAADSKAVAN